MNAMCNQSGLNPSVGRNTAIIREPSPLRRRTAATAWWGVILVLPFVLFYWLCPFAASLSLGSDFLAYYVPHQMEQMFALRTGTFILYIPGFFGGQSGAALTVGQVFHPVSHLATLLPGYWEGKAVDCIVLVGLVELGITHLLLFLFLNQLRLTRPVSFFISTVTVYNLCMLVLFWRGAALEAWTGHLLICIAVGWCWLKPGQKRNSFFVIGATYWTITSGYPQPVFYGFLGALLFTAVIPYFIGALFQQPPARKAVFGFWARTAFYFTAGILLSSAYMISFLEAMSGNTGRVGSSYAWSLDPNGTFVGSINSFFSPLKADWSMFGGSPLFLAAILIPAVRLLRINVPRAVWVLLGAVLMIFLYIQGDQTPIYPLAWKYLPFISTMRGPYRAAQMFLVPFMLLLVWIFQPRTQCDVPGNMRLALPRQTITALAALALTAIYVYLPDTLFANTFYACPYTIRHIPPWVEPVTMMLSVAILGAMALHGTTHRIRKALETGICIVTCILLAIIMRYGPMNISPKPVTPTFEQMLAQKRTSMDFGTFPYFLYEQSGRSIVMEQIKSYFLEPCLGKIYRKWVCVDTHQEAYTALNSGRKQDEAVVEQCPVAAPPPGKTALETPDTVKLAYSSYNRMVFHVTLQQQGFFVFSYPYTGHWRATVNGAPVALYRANGASHGVPLSSGSHVLEFRYANAAFFWGVLISCATLAAIGCSSGFLLSHKPARCAVILVSLIVGAGLFLLWSNALYRGDNLHTHYEWRTPPPNTPLNVAYGKPTEMSSHQKGFPYFYGSRRAVDGDTTPASCCITGRQEKPWWQIDLRRPEKISTISIYPNFLSPQFNQGLMTVAWSEDFRTWQTVDLEEGSDRMVQVTFPRPVAVRYVKIGFDGICHLSLNEVEIYLPPE